MKNLKKESFEINGLDHVAIRVKDLDAAAKWYESVLGLTKYVLPEWGPFPVFMLAGRSGVALFPQKRSDDTSKKLLPQTCIDHFAFNVTRKNFEKAKQKFSELNIKYNLQYHHYFHSIYITDPDGHTVELTTITVDEELFYKDK